MLWTATDSDSGSTAEATAGRPRGIRDRATRLLSGMNLVPLTIVVAAAGATRLAWIAIVRAQPVSDYLFYYRGAVNIATGHGFSMLDHPTAFFPVGYPAFLAAVFSIAGTDVGVMRFANIALWMVAAGLAFLLGVRVGGRAVGIVAGLIVACYPEYVIYSGLGASENLMVPLLLLFCVVMAGAPGGRLTPKRGLAAGVVLGLAMLVRSTALPVPILFAGYVVLRDRRALRGAAVMLAVATLVAAPWVARNRVVMGAPVMSTNGGYTLWMGLNPNATGGSMVKGGNPPWPIESVDSERQVNAQLMREAIDFVVRHPGDAVTLVPKKTRMLFRWAGGILVSSRAQTPADGSFKRTTPRTVGPLERRALNATRDNDWVFRALHATYLSLGAVGLVWALWRRRPGSDIVALIIGFWIVFHVTLVHGQTRFLVSVSPLLAPFAAYLAVSLARAVRSGLSRRRAPVVADPPLS
jgi:4-amino-4-deoxy-L-arabinose transferase-like glycosyltransferase